MLFDTTFLIDIERETKRRQPGRAYSFLGRYPDTPLYISVISAGEFAEGFDSTQEAACWLCLRPYTILGLDREIAWRAAQFSRNLRAGGVKVGDNDLWIGATAMHHNLELVTGNLQHFERIEGLRLVKY